jgi:hypothetical protein
MDNEKVKLLVDKITHQGWLRKKEFRLFKKCVRRFVSPDTYKLIADEYNREVSRFRDEAKKDA